MASSEAASRLCGLLPAVVAMAAWPGAGQSATLQEAVASGATALPGYFVLLYATDPTRALECADPVAVSPTRRDGSVASFSGRGAEVAWFRLCCGTPHRATPSPEEVST